LYCYKFDSEVLDVGTPELYKQCFEILEKESERKYYVG